MSENDPTTTTLATRSTSLTSFFWEENAPIREGTPVRGRGQSGVQSRIA